MILNNCSLEGAAHQGPVIALKGYTPGGQTLDMILQNKAPLSNVQHLTTRL